MDNYTSWYSTNLPKSNIIVKKVNSYCILHHVVQYIFVWCVMCHNLRERDSPQSFFWFCWKRVVCLFKIRWRWRKAPGFWTVFAVQCVGSSVSLSPPLLSKHVRFSTARTDETHCHYCVKPAFWYNNSSVHSHPFSLFYISCLSFIWHLWLIT